MTGTTTDYAGRQLDIELLQHVSFPVNQRVYPSVDHEKDGSGPRICAGMEKVVQRYAKLLLTDLGSMKMEPDTGGTLVLSIRRGETYSKEWLLSLFEESNRRVLSIMRDDDGNSDVFGDIPDDERIKKAELVKLDIDRRSTSVGLHVKITTEAGTKYEFVTPVKSGL